MKISTISIIVCVLLACINKNNIPEQQLALHKSFTLSKAELMTMVSEILSTIPLIPSYEKEQILIRIDKNPITFLNIMEDILLEQDQMLFALVDKYHPLPKHYEPPDLQELSEYPQLILNRQGMRLRKRILPSLLEMGEEAFKDGIQLDISSAYRDFQYQQKLFQWHVDTLGREEARMVSAMAGTSQHQLGTTIDFGSVTPSFATHPAGIWLANNAWRFGFSLSYPQNYEEITGYSYEPWHFRYLGEALIILQRDFFNNIQQYVLLFYHEAREVLQNSFKGPSK